MRSLRIPVHIPLDSMLSEQEIVSSFAKAFGGTAGASITIRVRKGWRGSRELRVPLRIRIARDHAVAHAISPEASIILQVYVEAEERRGAEYRVEAYGTEGLEEQARALEEAVYRVLLSRASDALAVYEPSESDEDIVRLRKRYRGIQLVLYSRYVPSFSPALEIASLVAEVLRGQGVLVEAVAEEERAMVRMTVRGRRITSLMAKLGGEEYWGRDALTAPLPVAVEYTVKGFSLEEPGRLLYYLAEIDLGGGVALTGLFATPAYPETPGVNSYRLPAGRVSVLVNPLAQPQSPAILVATHPYPGVPQLRGRRVYASLSAAGLVASRGGDPVPVGPGVEVAEGVTTVDSPARIRGIGLWSQYSRALVTGPGLGAVWVPGSRIYVSGPDDELAIHSIAAYTLLYSDPEKLASFVTMLGELGPDILLPSTGPLVFGKNVIRALLEKALSVASEAAQNRD